MSYYIKLHGQAWNTMEHSNVDPAEWDICFSLRPMMYSRPSVQRESERDAHTRHTHTEDGETERGDKTEPKERSICCLTSHLSAAGEEKYKRLSLLLSHHRWGERDGWRRDRSGENSHHAWWVWVHETCHCNVEHDNSPFGTWPEEKQQSFTTVLYLYYLQSLTHNYHNSPLQL